MTKPTPSEDLKERLEAALAAFVNEFGDPEGDASCPPREDGESVSDSEAGPGAVKFGHIRAVREALAALTSMEGECAVLRSMIALNVSAEEHFNDTIATLRADLSRAKDEATAWRTTAAEYHLAGVRKDEALREIYKLTANGGRLSAMDFCLEVHRFLIEAFGFEAYAALSPEPEAAPLPHVPGAEAPTEGGACFTRDEIMAALEPFADASRHLHPLTPGNHRTQDGIEVRHWVRAGIVFGDRQGKQARDESEL